MNHRQAPAGDDAPERSVPDADVTADGPNPRGASDGVPDARGGAPLPERDPGDLTAVSATEIALSGGSLAVSASAAGRDSIDQLLFKGLAFTGGVNSLMQVLRWSTTLLLARILVPADYGLVGMAIVFTGLVALVNEFGLGAAIIQQRDLDEDAVARLGGLSVLVGIASCLVSLAAAGPIARFFGEPAVGAIVRVLAFRFILDSLLVLPRALLTRDLRFGALAKIDAIDAFALSVLSIGAAVAGMGYWSLVIGSGGSAVIAVLVATRIRRHRIAWPRRLRQLERSMRFGRDVLVTRLTWYAYSNADFLIVGRLLDSVALGLYTMAWNIASVPVEKVSAVVGRVTPGIFSAVQSDVTELRRYFLLLTEAIAFITLPMSIGFMIVADDFVLAILGEKWRPAIPALRVLAAYASVRSVSALPPQIMTAMGRPDLARRANTFAAVVLPLCFVLGTRWGIVGVAAGWVVGYPLTVMAFTFPYTFRLLELSARRYLRALWPAVSGTLVMAVAAAASRVLLFESVRPMPRLFAVASVGAVTYCALALTVHRSRMEAIRSLVIRLRGRER
jgi:O-antigen/teichoic acid export membrane protein